MTKIVYTTFAGEEDVVFEVANCSGNLIRTIRLSPNERYLAFEYCSNTTSTWEFFVIDLKDGKEIGRYAGEPISQRNESGSQIYVFDSGKIVKVQDRSFMDDRKAYVVLFDITTGDETVISPKATVSACISGSNEPVIAINVQGNGPLIEPFQYFSDSDDDLLIGYPTEMLYFRDLSAKPVSFLSATASSTLTEDTSNPGMFGADKAIDGDPTTAWIEGADGTGEGEKLTITFPAPMDLISVTVFGGWGKSKNDYLNNTRPRQVLVTTDTGLTTKGIFQPTEGSVSGYGTESGRVEISLWSNETNMSTICSEITIEILETYAGERFSDCCISEVNFNFAR